MAAPAKSPMRTPFLYKLKPLIVAPVGVMVGDGLGDIVGVGVAVAVGDGVGVGVSVGVGVGVDSINFLVGLEAKVRASIGPAAVRLERSTVEVTAP